MACRSSEEGEEKDMKSIVEKVEAKILPEESVGFGWTEREGRQAFWVWLPRRQARRVE